MWPIFSLCTLSNVLHYLHWMHVEHAISNAVQKTFSMCTHFAPVMLWFMMELPGVFHQYFLLSSYRLPMQYFNPMEFRCWIIHCQSTTTHIITFHHPLKDTVGIHVGTPHLHHPGGQGLVINLTITSAAPTIVKTRLFPMAQTQKPTSFVLFAWAHTHNVYTCNTSRTWDGHHPTMAKRSRGDLHLWENDMPICMDWQRPWGCISTKHNIKHICLGCGTFTHRAHSCPCTQKYPNIVDSLYFGFNISLLLITTTQSPPNKESIIEFAEEFNKIVHNEIQKGQHIGPISGQDMETLISPFQSPLSQSSQNQVKWVNNITFRIIHFWSPLPLNSWICQFIHQWIQTPFLLPGALFQLSLYLFTNFHQAPNWLQETLQKHITQFCSTTLNSLLWLFTWRMTPLPLTLPYVLDQFHLLGYMVQFRMWLLISCIPKAMVQYLAGLMIISFSEFGAVSSQNTTGCKGNGTGTSHWGASIMKAVGFGLEDKDLKMAHWKNSMRIVPFPVGTCLWIQCDQQKTICTHTTLKILTPHHKDWASHGKSQKTGSLLAQQPTLGSTGTLKCTKSLWQCPRKKNSLR